MAEFGEFGFYGVEVDGWPVVFHVPLPSAVELRAEVIDGMFAAGELLVGLSHVVGEEVDPVQGRGLLRAAAPGELGERSEFLELLVGEVQAVVRCGEFALGRRERSFGLLEGRLPVGRPALKEGSQFVSFGEQLVDAAWGVVNGKGGVGLAAEGVEDFLFRGPLVGHYSAVIDLRESANVPGVSGVSGAALAGVAGEALQGSGAEQMDLGPGAALDAVDDQRNAKLVLNVVVGGDGFGYDLYRRRAPGGREC